MTPTELLRYSCQLALPGFDEVRQQQLQNAKVLIVGMGGLGCPAAQYLAATGIGHIGIVDFDTVSLGNLHRQILYTDADIGQRKTEVAAKRLQQQNPQITIVPYDLKMVSSNVLSVVSSYDIIVDCTDNFDTRYLLNDAAVLSGKPLVYGAIYQYEGQVSVWNISNPDGTPTPNYRDIFPAVDAAQIPDCAEGGVIPTLAGIIGCMQANEIIKYLTNTGELLTGKLLILDALTLQSRIINIGTVSRTTIVSLAETIEIPSLNVSQLKDLINKGGYLLIDVRTPAEHLEFNIGGKNIPLTELNNDNSFLDNGTIVFYCQSGKRSTEAAKRALAKDPTARVFSLVGGVKTWIEQM